MKNLVTLTRSTARGGNCRSPRMAESSNFHDESPIALIAQDHLHSVLLLLPVSSILSFATTCKRLKSLASSDTLWEALCRRDWGAARVDAIKASPTSKEPRFAWMRLYKQVSQLRSVSCHRLICSLAGDDELIPGPRASHSLNFVSDCLVLFGGGCEGGRHLDDTWVAHIDNDGKRVLTWQKVSSGMPSGRFGHTCVVVGDSLVVFGGINDHGVRQNDTWIGQLGASNTNGESSSRMMTLVWRLTEVGSFAPPPRGAHTACCIGDRRMLIYGGIGPNGIRIGDTWVLDLSDNYEQGTWREIVARPSPPPRSGHTLTTASTDGSKTVLFGGRGSGYDVLNDVWLLHFSEDDVGGSRWERLLFDPRSITGGTSLPRVGHSATLMLGGKVLVYGGEDSRRHRKNDFWLMDPVGCSSSSSSSGWRESGVMSNDACLWRRLKAGGGYGPKPRSFHAACTDISGRYLYVFGGMVDGVFEPAESYGLRFDGDFFVVELMLHL